MTPTEHNKKALAELFEFIQSAKIVNNIQTIFETAHIKVEMQKTEEYKAKVVQQVKLLINEQWVCTETAGAKVEFLFLNQFKFSFDRNTNQLCMFNKPLLAQESWQEIKYEKPNRNKPDSMLNSHPMDWLYLKERKGGQDYESGFLITIKRLKFSSYILFTALMQTAKVAITNQLMRDFVAHGFNEIAHLSFYEVTKQSKNKETQAKLKGLNERLNKFFYDIEQDCVAGDVPLQLQSTLADGFSSLFGEDWMRLYFYKHNYFCLKLMRDFIEQHKDSKDRLLEWEKYNPIMAMMLIRANCTTAQIQDDNIFSYQNLLSDETPFLKFDKKVQVRKFFALSLNQAMLIFNPQWIEFDERNYKGQISFFVGMDETFLEKVTRTWKLAIKWLEYAKDFENSDENLVAMGQCLRQAAKFEDVVDNVDSMQIGIFFNILYKQIKEINRINSKRARHCSIPLFGNVFAVNGWIDFASRRNARDTDWNINLLSTTTTAKSLSGKEAEWHKELQEVDYEKLMQDDQLLVRYHTQPNLKKLMHSYEIEEAVFEPILSNRELMLEGREMNHCIYSMREEVSLNQMCVFRGRRGTERVTVSLEIKFHNKKPIGFRATECESYGNGGVSKEMEHLADLLGEAIEREATTKHS